MIKSVRFQNFKALRDTTLPLEPFTLIIGPNGSGKSSALQAIEGVQARDLDGASVVTASFGQAEDAQASVEIRWTGRWKRLITTVRWLQNGARGVEHRPNSWDPEVNQVLGGVRVYTLDASAIAATSKLQPSDTLQRDGSHLAGVLDRLRDQHPERFEALNDELARCVPEFDRVVFDTPRVGERAFLLRMREEQHPIPASELSQGTLLALAILTLAYLPDPPKIIGLEEPDRGIHPRLLRNVRDALYRLSHPESCAEKRDPVQVIATTHSPYFLDLFKDHPEEIVIANKEEGGARFERLSDRKDLDEMLADAHLGDVWYTGILGGVPLER